MRPRARLRLLYQITTSQSTIKRSITTPHIIPAGHPRDRKKRETGSHGSSSSKDAPHPSNHDPLEEPEIVTPDGTSGSASSSSDSGSPPKGSNSVVISSPSLSPFPPTLHSSSPLPEPQLPFSTQKFVRKLEDRSENSLKRGAAEAIMEATRDMLQRQEAQVQKQSWRRGDLENAAYLFHAALTEIKTSAQIKSRNDSVILRSLTASLHRDTDAIGQRVSEEMNRLRSEIQLEMNQRKEETNADLKALDRAIIDLNSKFTILLSEARTEQESVKWVSTRRVMATLLVLVVGVLVAINMPRKSSDSSDEENDNKPPSVEDLGVLRTAGGPADVSSGSGWFWSGQGQSRVEGEGDGSEER
ncbi:hypothetical protein T439DRAFT_324858 [Meredithblackwellia eburnea MCA 4105]